MQPRGARLTKRRFLPRLPGSAAKVGAAFAAGGGLGGGVETTALDLTKSLLIHGMIIQGDPWASHYGAVSIGKPNASAKKECRKLGEKVATLVKRLTAAS